KGTSSGGGGIYSVVQSAGKLLITRNTLFSSCRSKFGNGGGMYVEIIGSLINNQTSIVQIINQVEFQRCFCYSDGGAVYADVKTKGQLSINETLMNECKSISSNGGGIYTNQSANNSVIHVSNLVELTKCQSNLDGGGIYAIVKSSNNLMISNIKLKLCKSTGKGGGIYADVSGSNNTFDITNQVQIDE
ncbi:MAG: hypothetical protein EZS28_055907, partial [Streblomastix strix]